MRFLISIPAWGRRCVDLFTGPVLDSHADALRGFGHDVRYLCHTDEGERISSAVQIKTGRPVICRLPLTVGNGKDHTILANCNRDALAQADTGDVVIFLNADIIISKETFRAIRQRIESGAKVIMCAGIRTLPKEPVPINVPARDLLLWALENQHPLTALAFYGEGKTRCPAVLLFRSGEAVMLRGFHLHPLAVCVKQPLIFRTTVDWDLAANFPKESVHVVVSPDELSIAEISPADKTHNIGATPVCANDVVVWARKHTIGFHRWLFSHRIFVRGDGGDFQDKELLTMMNAVYDNVAR